MTVEWDYAQALEELWQRSSYERGLISDPFGDVARAERGLARMHALLGELSDPQLQIPSVHIAGSKGKGSTGAFISSALKQAGYRTGFFSSPHLHRFPERIAIDGEPIADGKFVQQASTVAEAARRLEALEPSLGPVSTFEMITAMAFNAFVGSACDLAVVEVGLGGRYDATNVLKPLATIITRIDLEHTTVLGPTHADIAWQKAGILRRGVPTLSAPQVPDAEATLVRAAAEIGSPLQIGGRDWIWSGTWRSFDASGPWGEWKELSLGIPGQHQIDNACTALAALHAIDRARMPVPEGAIRRGVAEMRWPGRFERLASDGQVIVLDGAHTPAAAAALVETWQADYAGPATVIVGMAADKNAHAFLKAMRPVIGWLILTRSESPRAADPGLMASIANELDIAHEVQPTVAEAVAAARKHHPNPVVVTGSLFVVGEAREALGLAEPDRVWIALNQRGSARPILENCV